jgi:hypothetical protein
MSVMRLLAGGRLLRRLRDRPVRLDYAPREIWLLPTVAVRQRAVKKEPETAAWIEETFRPGDVLYDDVSGRLTPLPVALGTRSEIVEWPIAGPRPAARSITSAPSRLSSRSSRSG